MFGKARSSIPLPGIKSGIPMKRHAQPTSTGRSTQAGTSSGIPVASKVRKQTIILHVTTKLAFVIQLLNSFYQNLTNSDSMVIKIVIKL